MTETAFIIAAALAGFAVGAFLVWIIVGSRFKAAQAILEARAGAAEQQRDDERSRSAALKTEMTDTFNALSSAALKSSSEDFLRLASEHLGRVVVETEGKLGKHQTSIDATIQPLQEMLRRYELQIKEMEDNRHKSHGSLSEQIRSLSGMQDRLQQETHNLVTALRRPKVSGSWGELGLKRVPSSQG